MKRRALVALSCLLAWLIPWGVCLGVEQGDERLACILDELRKAQGSTQDLLAGITQVKSSPLLKEPITSHGELRFKRPNKIWVQMSPPYPTITVLNKGVLWIYFPEEKTAQRYRVAQNPALAKWLLLFQNPIETLGARISLLNEKEGEAILGVDTSDELSVFRTITLWIDTSFWMPKKIEMVERNGDRTIISYYNIRINTDIPDSSFELRLPRDVEILEPMKH